MMVVVSSNDVKERIRSGQRSMMVRQESGSGIMMYIHMCIDIFLVILHHKLVSFLTHIGDFYNTNW